MKILVVYSRHDFSRNWPSEHVPEGVQCLDWYDFELRKEILNQTGPLHVGLFPTIFIWTEQWSDYTNGLTNSVINESQWLSIIEPDNWQIVENTIKDYEDRSLRGWADIDDIPPDVRLIWTDPPEVEKGETVQHDGWGMTEDGAIRKWVVFSTPQPPSVEVLGD